MLRFVISFCCVFYMPLSFSNSITALVQGRSFVFSDKDFHANHSKNFESLESTILYTALFGFVDDNDNYDENIVDFDAFDIRFPGCYRGLSADYFSYIHDAIVNKNRVIIDDYSDKKLLDAHLDYFGMRVDARRIVAFERSSDPFWKTLSLDQETQLEEGVAHFQGIDFHMKHLPEGYYPYVHEEDVLRGMHKCISPFWIMTTPVTASQYRAVMSLEAESEQLSAFPMTNISYQEAQLFINKLNGLDIESGGRGGFRLPSRSEWMYAARGLDRLNFPWGEDVTQKSFYGWFDSEQHPVGMKKPNTFGLFDILGNVKEFSVYKKRESFPLESYACEHVRTRRDSLSWSYTQSCPHSLVGFRVARSENYINKNDNL